MAGEGARFEVGFTQAIGLMFLLLAVFVVAAGTGEVANIRAVQGEVTGISASSLPELVDNQKILLSIENLRRFAEVAYVSRDTRIRREARLSAREVVGETAFLSSGILRAEALRSARIIDSIVRVRAALETEHEAVRISAAIYLQSLESISPYLRTPQDRQAAFGLLVDFFLSPREEMTVRDPAEVTLAFQRHIREVQMVLDRLGSSQGPATRSYLEAAMLNLDSSLHAIASSLNAIGDRQGELNDLWEEIDGLLRSMRDSVRLGAENSIEGALAGIGEASEEALVKAHAIFGILIALLAADFILLYAFVSRPLRWTSRKLTDIQEGILDTPAPVIRVREVADLARLLDRFSSRLVDIYRQTNELEEAAAGKRDLEEVMRAVFLSSLDGYVVWRDAGVELVSPMILKLLGLDSREEFRRGYASLGFHPDRLAELLTIASFEKSVREEAQLVSKGGKPVPVELTHLPVRLRGADCLLTYIRDLRRQKRSEQALMEAKEQAEVAARAKTEFLANMSHEVLTPMNGILGYTRSILKDGISGDQRRKLMLVEDHARRLSSVMNDILDYSAIETGKVSVSATDFRLERVLRSAIERRISEAEARGIEIFMRIPPLRGEVLTGDSALLGKVLDRLIDNAVKFTEEGYVCLEASELRGDDPAPPEGAVTVLLTVHDTGIGVPMGADDCGIFRAFHQADNTASRRHGGTGLGLAFAKRAVELLGGRIWCEPRPGGGSSFRFTVRFLRSRADPADEGALRGMTALVAAVPTPSREALAECLDYFCLSARVVSGMGEAAAVIDGGGVTPDFLLLDARLPGALDFLKGRSRGGRVGPPAPDGAAGEPTVGGGTAVVLMGSRTAARSFDAELSAGFLERPCCPEMLYLALVRALARE
ncbi:MAG: hypothetical protein LBG06_01030 [Deltaproteobacteria bacterium]|nr:hypothetical protein [Deltaproteobacteria bacterium]